jgi:catechol 2,3-dioxygenase-like lactoylglutathione lyase family enzyme
MSVSAIFHSHSSVLSGLIFLAAAVCLFLFLERAFPSVYSDLRRPRPWWETRAAQLPILVAFAFIISILSSRVATLWFGLLIISGGLVALLLRVTTRDSEPLALGPKVASGLENHFQVAGQIPPQPGRKSSRTEQVSETFRPMQMRGTPPFSIPDNYAIDVRNLAASRDWYKEKLGLREVDDDREEDSGRPFTDLHISSSEAFLSLVELPLGGAPENRHIVFFAKNLKKAHQWLAERGVLVEPITTDSGGNRLFRFQDLEGNGIEICVEPG